MASAGNSGAPSKKDKYIKINIIIKVKNVNLSA